MKAIEELGVALCDAFQVFRETFPHISLRAIALSSGVNRYFLSKIEKRTLKNDNVDLKMLLTLTGFLAAKQPLHTPSVQKLQEVVRRLFHVDLTSVEARPSSYDQVDLYDPNTYFTLVFASFRRGVPKKHIKEFLGKAGQKALEELFEKKLIQEEKGRIRLASKDEFIVSFRLLIHHAPNYFRFYQLRRAGQGRNAFHLYAEGLNSAAFRVAQKLHREFTTKMAELFCDPKNVGDIGCFSVCCFDSFSEDITEEE